jgi:multidrug efflux pump
MSWRACPASARSRFWLGEYAMRVWLDPNKVAARGLTASDVVTAMQEQNVQVSAGQLGAEPLPKESDFLISINAQGVCIPKKSLAILF